jgi:hypothetical protein
VNSDAHSILMDLVRVGPTKPVGYLPIDTLRRCGIEPWVVARDLEANGCSTAELSPVQCHIGYSGALYAWHEPTLKRLLDAHRGALGDWPTDPRAFVLRVAREYVREEVRPALHALIGRAFDDSRYRSAPAGTQVV